MVGRKPKFAPTNEEWENQYNAEQGDQPPEAEEYGRDEYNNPDEEAEEYGRDEYNNPDEEAVETFGGLWD